MSKTTNYSQPVSDLQGGSVSRGEGGTTEVQHLLYNNYIIIPAQHGNGTISCSHLDFDEEVNQFKN